MKDNDFTDLSKRELLQLLQDKQRKIDSLETACAGYEKIITGYKRENNNANCEIETLNSQYEDIKKHYLEEVRKVSSLSATVNVLVDKLANLRQQLGK